MPPDNGGPYVAAAFFCEKVLEEKDGIVTAVRIFDRINLNVGTLDPARPVPEELPPTLIPLTFLIVLRAGQVRGRHRLGLRVESPSGIRMDLPPDNVVLQAGTHSANIIGNFQFGVQQEGVYWVDVVFDDDFLTKISLEVVYLPQTQM